MRTVYEGPNKDRRTIIGAYRSIYISVMTDIQKKNCLQSEGRCTKFIVVNVSKRGCAVMSYSFWWSVLQEVVCVKTPEPRTLAVVTKTVISDMFFFFLSVPALIFGFPPTVTVSFLERSFLPQNRNGVNLLFFTGQNSCGFF